MITFLYTGSNKTLLILVSCLFFLNVVTKNVKLQMWLTFVDHVIFYWAGFESEEHSYLWRTQMSETLLKTDAISVTTRLVINIIQS